MSRGKLGIFGVVLLAVSLIAVPGASAATEFGNSCKTNAAIPESTFVQLTAAAGDPLAVAAPISGVVTQWSVNSGGVSPTTEKLQIFRPTLNANEYTVVGESAEATMASGLSSHPTQIPIRAGDHLGIAAGSATGWVLYCSGQHPGDSLGTLGGSANLPLGSTRAFAPAPTFQVGVTATIEPDADGDGYGDETQDKCPQSGATQGSCPVIALEALVKTKKKLVNVIVTASAQAKVTVSGGVSLGKGKKAILKGATIEAAPGLFTRFRLDFPPKLTKRLHELAPKQSLALKLTVSAQNLAGPPTTKNLAVKLKGQGPKS